MPIPGLKITREEFTYLEMGIRARQCDVLTELQQSCDPHSGKPAPPVDWEDMRIRLYIG